MKLSNKALEIIRTTKKLRNRLALDLDKSPSTLNRWLADNDDNLTKAAALKVIREETGLTDDQILESEPADSQAA